MDRLGCGEQNPQRLPTLPGSAADRRRSLVRRTLCRAAPGLVLAAENAAVFRHHYFQGWGFPWDFLGPYYAMVAYWTTGVRLAGSLPQWVPYQSMGYPFAINLQSGLSYPFFWVFPLFDIGYSLHGAVVFQCLHVLAGALGAYALARRLGRARRDALLAAFAFQLFGGFYSNAEHPDIVRGFALAPWLLWSLTLPPARARRRGLPLLLAPAAVFLLASGGYPGTLVAGLFLGAAWVALQTLDRIRATRAVRPVLPFAASAAILVGLGLAMAALHLGPAWLHRAELARYQERSALDAIVVGPAQWPGLFLPNGLVPGNVSMTSTFLPMALLLPVLWAPVARRGALPALGLTVLAAAMAAGPSSPLYRFAGAIAPPLSYSRLPAADYRGFLALGLALLGAAGLSSLRRRGVRLWSSWRLALFAALLVWGLAATLSGRFDSWVAAAAVASALAAAALIALVRRRRPRSSLALASALAVLMLADAGRVLLRMQHLDLDLWRVPDIEGLCRRRFPGAFPEGFDGRVPRRLFEARSGPRGPRHAFVPGAYKAAGYLRGELLVSDHSGTVLAARRAVEQNPAWDEYMKREWTPLLLNPAADAGDPAALSAALLEASARAGPRENRVAQVSWGNETSAYEVHLERPALFVENEIFFPGWKAALTSGPGGPDTRIEALRVGGAFRGWRLPEGTYRMTARFDFPERRILGTVTAIAWVVWAGALGLSASRRRRPGTPFSRR